MEQPSIQLLGIRIDEPVTTLTDLIITIVCFYAFFKLFSNKNKYKDSRFLNYFFLTMGLATLMGGLIGHGFIYIFQYDWQAPTTMNPYLAKWLEKAARLIWKLPGWLTSMISIWLLERSSIEYARSSMQPRFILFLKIANIIELITFMFITFYTLNFRFVEIHSAFGLLAVNLPIHAYIYYRSKNVASKTFLLGLFFAIISAIVYKNQISIHTWFNHYDLSHVFMAIGIYIFYMAGKQLHCVPSYNFSLTKS